MNLLVINKFGKSEIITAKALPRIGDKIDRFYYPYPTINSIVMWPRQSLLQELNCEKFEIEALILVD
jgi:hypothetical protein